MKRSVFGKQVQKGFTLLELLVVVAIIAILSVGAILAYDGLTDKAQSATASLNTVGTDQAIRNYRVVTGNYPNQWDHLVANDGAGSALDFVAEETYQKLARVDATAISSQVLEALDEVGIEELQARTVAAGVANVEPNLQHSEGGVNGDPTTFEIELEDDEYPTNLVIVPSSSSSTICSVGGNAPAAIVTGDEDATMNATNAADAAENFLTQLNDNIGEDNCHLVVAFGFGHDAAHSTVNSNAAIAAAPAFVSKNINPAESYARYIALFDMGVDNDNDQNIEAGEIYSKARFIGLITPDGGQTIDENQAAANDETQNQ